MRTLVAQAQASRFTPIAELARSVIDAPAGPDGIPCVHVRLEDIEGQPALVAKTCDEKQTTLLLLPDRDPRLLEAALAYLVERLTSIGLAVVPDEAQLEAVH